MTFSLAVLAPPALLPGIACLALGFAQPGRIGRSPLALIELLALVAVALAGGTMAALAIGGATTLTPRGRRPRPAAAGLPARPDQRDDAAPRQLRRLDRGALCARPTLMAKPRHGVFTAWLCD
jgi:hypothetical protein